MADRVKYFVLGLLFLVVAGVIAYDRWNRKPVEDAVVAENPGPRGDRFEVIIGDRKPPAADEPAPPPPDVAPPPPVKRDLSSLRSDPRTDPPKPKPEVVPPAPEPKPSPAVIHVVKSGENLTKIALRYYKTHEGVAWIAKANNLRDPDSIRENQKLVIPARKEMTRRTGSQPQVKSKTAPGKVPSRYVVKAGDGDLYAICRRFYGAKGEGARVARIMQLNGLWSANVKPGTILRLPPK